MAFDPFIAPPGADLSGYRLEKPLVADANAATAGPPDTDIGVGTDTPTEWLPGGIFDSDLNDQDRRKEYLIRAARNPVTDRDEEYIEDARYEWTVNEGLGTTRQEYFGFNAALRRWDLLTGRSPSDVGIVGTATAFLKPIPVEGLFTVATYREPVPFSVSIGNPSSLLGTQLTVVMVDTFGTPAAGTVECDRATGELNFSATELAASPNSPVFYQQQRFFTLDEVQQSLGPISNDPILAFNPIPPTGSIPQIKVGFRDEYLTPLEELTEPLTPPPPGSVAWAADTGVLLFNTTDLTTFATEEIYYDGVVLENISSFAAIPFGTLGVPGSFGVEPPAGDAHVFTFLDGGGVRRAFITVLKLYESQLLVPPGPFLESEILDDPANIPINEIQIANDTGKVAVSAAAVATYGAATVLTQLNPELSIIHSVNHGWRLQLRRTPVNPERADDTPRDVLIRTLLADQVIATSLGFADRVFLPGSPIQGSLVVDVQQNTGSFIGDLPSFDAVIPSFTGLVHIVEPLTRTLRFGDRRVFTGLTVLPDRITTLPDQFLVEGSVTLLLNAVPVVPGDEALVDLIAGQITFITIFGAARTTGFRGETTSASIFTDTTQDFVAAGVIAGDRLVVQSGPLAIQGSYVIVDVPSVTTLEIETIGERSAPFASTGDTGLVYEVHTAPDILADNTFDPVVTQAPFVTVFRIPTSGPEELLTIGVDYELSPEFGTALLTNEPLLEGEKLRIIYNQDESGEVGTLFNEIAGVRVTEDLSPYNTTAHTFAFNSAGLTPISGRGSTFTVQGRPVRAIHFAVNFPGETVTITRPTQSDFEQPNEQRLTDGPNLFTYYVEEAFGGEVDFQVLNTPVHSPPFIVEPASTSIVVTGDQTTTMVPGRIVRVGRELALIATSVYDAGEDETTVTFTGALKSKQRNPEVFVSRYTPEFIALPGGYDPVAIDTLVIRFTGDVTSELVVGTQIALGDHVHQITGVEFSGGQTVVQIRTKTREAMTSTSHPASFAFRPVFEIGTQVFATSLAPILSPNQNRPVDLFVRRSPLPGTLLERNVDYTVAGGTVTLDAGLASGEALDLEYTGINPQSGSLDATYTRFIAPDNDNGLLRQRLVVDMLMKSPDSWFTRVEPIAQFVVETLGDLEERALALLPSSGPVIAAPGPLANFEQGRRSLTFERGKIVDEDFVARRMLQFTDTLDIALEGFLRWLIGLVPGDVIVDSPITSRLDGPFRFAVQEADATLDGWLNPYDPFDAPSYLSPDDPARLNHIDDLVKIDTSPFLFTGTGTPLVALSIGTFKAAWERHRFSRLFTQERVSFTRTFDGGPDLGDPLAILSPPVEVTQAKLLTYRSSTQAEMNSVSIRYLFDYNLTEDDQLEEATLYQSRSVLFQVVDPDPDPSTSEVLVDLRALGDVNTPEGWKMFPEMFRPSLDDFDTEQGGHCDIYRRGFVSPLFTDLLVTFGGVTATEVTVVLPSKLALEIGDVFFVSLLGTPPISFPDVASYSLDRSNHRLLNNEGIAAGPPLPPSDGGLPLEIDGLIRLFRVGPAPLRIPALFGLPYNDDWDQVPPLTTPVSAPEPELLQNELAAVGAVKDDTTRGFSGETGSFTDSDDFSAGTILESDGEDFSEAGAPVEAFDSLRIVDDPSTPANEGHFLARGGGTTSFLISAFQWAELAVTFDVVIRRGVGDTLVGTSELEDLSGIDFTVLLGTPLAAYLVVVETGPDVGPYTITSVTSATKIVLAPPIPTGSIGAAYRIEYTGSGNISADLKTVTDISGTGPDLSAVFTTGDPLIVSGTTRNDGTFFPTADTGTSVDMGPIDLPSTGLTWFVKRGREIHSSSEGQIASTTDFRDKITTVNGTLTIPAFLVTLGALGDTQVGDVVIFPAFERAVIISITAGPTLGLSFTTAPPADGPFVGVDIFRNFELSVVGSTHPTRTLVNIGDVLVMTDTSKVDFARYIIDSITEEILTVAREADLVTTFFSTAAFPKTGLSFKIDDCRRNELNDPDAIVGLLLGTLSDLKDVYDDTAVIPEIAYSLLNHIDNADDFAGALIDLTTPLVTDVAATLTDSITVTGSVTLEDFGVVAGDILWAVDDDPTDVNHNFYVIASVSGAVVTIDPSVGPLFYTSHPVTAKKPEFSSTPATPRRVRIYQNTGFVSSFTLLAILQEKIQGTEMLLQISSFETLATHAPGVDVTFGDPSNAQLLARIGPDLTSQYIANITDRLERVRDFTGNVLYEDIYAILYAVDSLFEQRYGWISLRTDNVSGTLPRLRRFDDTVDQREQDLLSALLLGGG